MQQDDNFGHNPDSGSKCSIAKLNIEEADVVSADASYREQEDNEEGENIDASERVENGRGTDDGDAKMIKGCMDWRMFSMYHGEQDKSFWNDDSTGLSSNLWEKL